MVLKRPNFDLVILSGAALIAMIVALVHNLGVIQIVFTMLLVFFLPGYAAFVALFPRRPFSVESLVFSIGISLSIVIVLGLIQNYTVWGLLPESWIIFLGDGTVALCVIALLRRWNHPSSLSVQPWRMSIRSFLLVSFAVLITISAVALSSNGARQQAQTQFTELWMVPAQPNMINLGVKNDEPDPTLYKLRLVDGDNVLQEWSPLKLNPSEQWEIKLTVPTNSGHRIEALLYRLDAPDQVYRHVSLSQ